MNAGARAEDAVSVRRLRLRGMSEVALRRSLATVVTPRVRRWVFVRRMTIRAPAPRIGAALQRAIAQISAEAGADSVAFPDFAALVVACARASLGGGLGGSWHWRALGLPPFSPAGEAVATLLATNAIEAGAAVASLARHDLLAPVWRSMPDAAAARLLLALADATGMPIPTWPDRPAPPAGTASPAPAAGIPSPEWLARAETFWRPALAGLPPRAEAVRAACVLAALRWFPAALASGGGARFAALVERLTAGPPAPPLAPAPPLVAPSAGTEPAPAPGPPPPPVLLPPPGSADSPGESRMVADEPAPPVAASASDALEIATDWGGVLFLVNALTRLGIADRLADEPDGPTGWRVLHDLALALGLPPDEPIAGFLQGQDTDTDTPPDWIASLLRDLARLYEADGPWPLPLAQPGRLIATETHLDLHLPARTIDIGLRLAGLDLDPGWVPWLGRVIAFHYDEVPVHLARSR